jgi:hypothetical protein
MILWPKNGYVMFVEALLTPALQSRIFVRQMVLEMF